MPTARHVIMVLPAILVPVLFFASMSWLKATFGGVGVSLAAAAAAVFEMGYGNYLVFRSRRRLDEVQRASAGFAAQWGPPLGQTVFVVLIMLPPVKHLATRLVLALGGPGPGLTVDTSVVVFAMILGFMVLVLLQSLGTVIINAFWWGSKQ